MPFHLASAALVPFAAEVLQIARRVDVVPDGAEQVLEAVLGPGEHDPPRPQRLDPQPLPGPHPRLGEHGHRDGRLMLAAQPGRPRPPRHFLYFIAHK